MLQADDFTDEQKRYLEGFMSGVAARRPPPAPAAPAGPEAIHISAQDRFTAAGARLVPEEKAKRDKNPFDMWDEIVANSAAGRYPKGTDVFLTKYHGLFYVAPAENAYMCRLRIPNGVLTAAQMAGLADIAERLAGGGADVTTRANLQLRRIAAGNAAELLMAVADLGLTARGSGADNIRNVTGSPTAGIDRDEILDTRPHARRLHHHILNHRELYGLPRKFNVAFDGGGRVAVLEDTNDIAFAAARIGDTGEVVYRIALGGITGHRDFARDTGLVCAPDEAVAIAVAMIRVFIAHGDRTDRTRARLKYLLDRWGFAKFIAETESELGRALHRVDPQAFAPRAPRDKHGHVGVHAQIQPGLNYLGVVVPVGRLTSGQMRGLADVAQRHGSGTIRLTVWQNLLISDVPDAALAQARADIAALGLAVDASPLRGGLVACTGNQGCKFAAADTKRHAVALVDHLEPRVAVDRPLNIHLTGCHHSCAQHYVGDIGLIGAKVDGTIEGYHLHVGGGAHEEQRIGREILRDIRADDLGPVVERLLAAYLADRHPDETFHDFTGRTDDDTLRRLASGDAP